MQIDTNYTCLLLRHKLGQTAQSLYWWLLVPSFLSRLPNFPSKGLLLLLMVLLLHLIKALTTFHLWVHFLFKVFQLFFSLRQKNFFSILQLSYILNSTSTECSSFSSHLPSAKYTTKITLLFVLYILNRFILLLYNQEFLQI